MSILVIGVAVLLVGMILAEGRIVTVGAALILFDLIIRLLMAAGVR